MGRSKNDVDAENVESENEDDEEDDFDSECSVSSNLDSKLLEFVEQFRKETQVVVITAENQFFQLSSADSEEVSTRTIEAELHNLKLNQESNDDNVTITSGSKYSLENRRAIEYDESRLSSAQQREEVLSLVQSQLSEIEESIRVSLISGFLYCISQSFFSKLGVLLRHM